MQKWTAIAIRLLPACGTALVVGAALLGATPARAFSSANSDTIMDAFNTAFYVSDSTTTGHYQESQTGGTTGFWDQAEDIEAQIGAYERNPTHGNFAQIMTNLLNRFDSTAGQGQGTNWSWNIYNDDVTWAVLANIRAYQDTGIPLYKNCAIWNFNMMYARAWDTTYFGGGLFWTTAKTSKNSCINFPACIAAYRIYQVTGNSSYLTEAQNIYNWAKGYLWNSSTGQVYDNINTNGTVSTGATTYNQGTFCGAASYLGDTTSAQLVADYTMNSMGTTSSNSGGYNLLPQYGLENNNSGFNSICIRWINRYMTDHNMQSRYLPWLQTNAQTAWNIRLTSDNLSWCQWHTNTPSGTDLWAWDCVSSATALQAIEPTQ